jgi:cobalt-zinc-cadmium efflux system protein
MKDAQQAAQHTAHLHAHKRGDAKHLHYRESHQAGILLAALLLTFFFAGIEAFAGFWANSLALISDAGHMVTDASALALALLAQIIAKRPPSIKNSFGLPSKPSHALTTRTRFKVRQ